MEAVKEAIAGAQQNALAEKMARRTNKGLIPPAADYQVAQVDHHIATSSTPTAAAAPPVAQPQSVAEPIGAPQQQVMRSRRESPSPTVVDAQVQTDHQQQQQQLKVTNCSNCENNKNIFHNNKVKGINKSQFIRYSLD